MADSEAYTGPDLVGLEEQAGIQLALMGLAAFVAGVVLLALSPAGPWFPGLAAICLVAAMVLVPWGLYCAIDPTTSCRAVRRLGDTREARLRIARWVGAQVGAPETLALSLSEHRTLWVTRDWVVIRGPDLVIEPRIELLSARLVTTVLDPSHRQVRRRRGNLEWRTLPDRRRHDIVLRFVRGGHRFQVTEEEGPDVLAACTLVHPAAFVGDEAATPMDQSSLRSAVEARAASELRPPSPPPDLPPAPPRRVGPALLVLLALPWVALIAACSGCTTLGAVAAVAVNLPPG